jgi:hypothetical protein
MGMGSFGGVLPSVIASAPNIRKGMQERTIGSAAGYQGRDVVGVRSSPLS